MLSEAIFLSYTTVLLYAAAKQLECQTPMTPTVAVRMQLVNGGTAFSMCSIFA